MQEDWLYYLWQFKRFHLSELKTECGQSVTILKTGERNSNAGPDFFNAKIIIGDTLWAGNVELHLKASDFIKHKHEGDPRYRSIILHVVFENDLKGLDTLSFFTLELKKYTDEKLLSSLKDYMSQKKVIKCGGFTFSENSLVVENWLERLTIERLERKVEQIISLQQKKKYSNEELLFALLLRGFGYGINAEYFEWISNRVSLAMVRRIGDHPDDVEALLLGASNLLSATIEDDYFIQQKKTYKLLSNKFQLSDTDIVSPSFLRLRPAAFPVIRLSQFANFICRNQRLMEKVLAFETVKDVYSFLHSNSLEYWNTHYVFGKSGSFKVKQTGAALLDLILVNVIVPFLFYYGKKNNEEIYLEKALLLASKTKPENNSVIKAWKCAGYKVSNAAKSQAFLELYNNYCSKNRCMECAIGCMLIK